MIEELMNAVATEANRLRWMRQITGTVPQSRKTVLDAERAVRAHPEDSFRFDSHGFAKLEVEQKSWDAGRFDTLSLASLRARVSENAICGRCRLCVLQGSAALSDVAVLQAFFGGDAVFQVASQFNALESPAPSIVRVSDYFHDPTQGPRASISAFPGTLLRQYAAPRLGGGRFTQVEDAEQVNLLVNVAHPETARVKNGYLRARDVFNPEGFAESLIREHDAIQVGVHEGVEVVRGYAWDGPTAYPHQRIAQIFTSTLAAGGYSPEIDIRTDPWRTIASQLLRAAYLGTLLAAVVLRKQTVILTLIGGGVFGNPHELIRDSISWACDEFEAVGPAIDVVVNIRENDPTPYRDAVNARGGMIIRV